METIETQLEIVSAMLTRLLLDTIPKTPHWIELKHAFSLGYESKSCYMFWC